MKKLLIAFTTLLCCAVSAEVIDKDWETIATELKPEFTTPWIDSDETARVLKKMNKNNLFPCTIEGKVAGDTHVYKASYCEFTTELRYFYSRWGISDEAFEEYNRYYTKHRMTLHSRSTFRDAEGNNRHQATWLLLRKTNAKTTGHKE